MVVTIEKVKSNATHEYYNFRPPEPRGFWGYIQLVQRDFIAQEIQLEYRRHRLLSWDRAEIQYLIELRCLVKAIGKLSICGMDAILALVAKPQATSPVDPVPTIEECLPDWVIARDRFDQIPREAITGIWYSFEPGFEGFITLTYQDYAKPCDAETGSQSQPQPAANAPGAGESGPNSGGGGGQRPAPAPPPERSSDPLSDNPAPPADSPGGPLVPTGQAPKTRVTSNQFKVLTGVGCNTVTFPLVLETEGSYPDIARWSLEKQVLANVISCPGFSTAQFQFKYDGVAIGGVQGPAGFEDSAVGQVVSVQSL
jgi:hypothetical protein